MSEETNKKKQSRMQRILTGVILACALLAVVFVGGWLMALVAVVCLVIALREEYMALKVAGHHPVIWPSLAALIASLPLMFSFSAVSTAPVLLAASVAILVSVMVRQDPDLVDVLVSAMPLFTLVFPGICFFGILDVESRPLQLYLQLLLFAVPTIGDTFAYFVGSSVGGPKLCPHISPNKTISGSLGGLLGSMLSALIVGRCFVLFVPGVAFPPFWADLIVGLLGGIVGQMGDLFASMVKRHCKIKDFSNIFPGHGGMLDRMDSIVFMSIIVYCYRLLIL